MTLTVISSHPRAIEYGIVAIAGASILLLMMIGIAAGSGT
jgi:hypothetical protein